MAKTFIYNQNVREIRPLTQPSVSPSSSNVVTTPMTFANTAISGSSTIASSLVTPNIANRGWTQTSAFSVTDLDTVAWGAGTFTSADGTSYSIGAGNTGNMSARTYIYLDIAVSTTAYQTTTTASTGVGAGKVLLATAINGAVEPEFEVFGGAGGSNINASQIVAGSLTANEIAASTITSGKMSVSQLSAIAADLGTVTAGSISINSGVASISSAGAAVFKSIQVGGSSTQYTMNDSGIFSFGDGSDGTGTFDGSATPTGSSKSGSDYTLTRDVYYTNATLSTGVTLNPAGYRLFGTGTLTLNGTAVIRRNGNAGANGGTGEGGQATGGAALADGYLKGSIAGANSTNPGNGTGGDTPGVAGVNGTATSNSIGENGTAGGTGGSGSGGGGGAGGTGGSGGIATASNVKLIANWHLATLLDVGSTGSSVKFDNSAGAASGGSGGGFQRGAGGAGGSGGGIVAIYFRSIVIGASASITANGGAGGNGGLGTSSGGGGGGGAGGNGGQLILVYNALTNSGSITVNAGSAGSGGSVGGSGGGGGVGSSGSAGTIRQFQISL